MFMLSTGVPVTMICHMYNDQQILCLGDQVMNAAQSVWSCRVPLVVGDVEIFLHLNLP